MMLKIIVLKVFFLICALLISINIFELIPNQIFSLDFFTQLSLWVLCIGFFTLLKLPVHTHKQTEKLIQAQHYSNANKPSIFTLMCTFGMSAFVVSYFVGFFVI